MRTKWIGFGARATVLGLTLSLGGCLFDFASGGGGAGQAAYFTREELARIDARSCEAEVAASTHGDSWPLCAYGWRPLIEAPNGQKAVESYRLLWARDAHPRMAVRISRYADGSGAMWVTTDEKTTAITGPHTQAAAMKIAELAPLFDRLDRSPIWTASASPPGEGHRSGDECKNLARWIIEGERKEDHRAVSVQTCEDGQWVIDLGTNMLRFAQKKFANLPVDPIY